MNDAYFTLFSAVARFYDACGYLYTDRSGDRKVSIFKCVGTEAQQVQTKLYYEFLKESMHKACEVAYTGEKLLSDLTDKTFDKSGFRSNFYKGFAFKVKERLHEMKQEREDHEHKQYTKSYVEANLKLKIVKRATCSGLGAQMGMDAGGSVSLNKQTGGSQRLAITGR
jgi:hypothetical protein